MKARATHLLKDFERGDNATLKVPEFDRGPSDPRNLLVVIMDREDELYTVGCQQGTLRTKYTAADLEVVSEKLLTIDEVPELTLPLSTAISKGTGGQGYTKCACKKSCATNRCSCTKHKMKCNSRCHPGFTCSNRD